MPEMILSLLLATLAQTATPATPPAPPAVPAMQGMGGRGMGMRAADTNGDGVITRQEALAQAGERFDRMDTNHDGKLDATELAAMRRGPRGGRGDMPPPPRDQ
jgi:hypothetical protein